MHFLCGYAKNGRTKTPYGHDIDSFSTFIRYAVFGIMFILHLIFLKNINKLYKHYVEVLNEDSVLMK